ncbi:MAG: tRNA methyltransferase [Candidatus Latescibacteria bacterium]|nr:tRNA methyltransferase [Candidatus Latescibacterota bacterium]
MHPLNKVGIKRLYQRILRTHPPRAELVLLLQSLENAINVGSLFRLADSLGAGELIFTGRTQTPPHPEISVTSVGHENRVPWRRIAQIEEAITTLKAEGYHCLAVELCEEAVIYTEYPYPPKVCLVLGNENKGVYRKTLALCDGAAFIPMYGKGRSMNVHVAAALIGYQALMGCGASDQTAQA